MSRIHEQKTFKSVNDRFSNLKKEKILMRSYSFSWKKRITFSLRKSREFSLIFPNIVNNFRSRRKFSFYLEFEIHRCAWYASFCSVIVHRSNYRSSLIKSLSLSLFVIIVVQVFENTFENKLFLLSSRSRDFQNGISFRKRPPRLFFCKIYTLSPTWRKFHASDVRSS